MMLTHWFANLNLDHINAFFGAGGVLCRMLDCASLYEDRHYNRGATITSALYFMTWGAFNLVYYSSLQQGWSFWTAVALVLMNVVWIALVLRLKR